MRRLPNITFLKSLPIAKKICLVTLCTSTITLLLLSSVYFFFNWTQYKERQTARLDAIAGITASATEAALMFDDKQAASEYLSWLQHEQDLEQAILLDSQNNIFASYYSEGNPPHTKKQNWQELTAQSNGLSYFKYIYNGSTQLGAIYLQTNRSTIQNDFSRSLLTATLLFIGALGITFWLSRTLSRAITSPITDLAELAEDVSRTPDYTKKAKKVYDDEIGSLVDSFNRMLERIQKRDETIKRSHLNLENLVRERTTELQKANKTLLIQTEHAQAASRAKSDFLSVMSHEIRTPMNAIVGMSSLLAEENENQAQRETIDVIQKSSDTLLSLVDNILDYSKIEAGYTELEKVEFSLDESIVQPLIVVAAQNEDAQISFIADCSPELPATLIGDPTRLRQIVTNLLSNAVKFTTHGHVILEVNCDREAHPPVLEINVSDTGIGIPQDRIDRLFKHFSQVDTSTTRRYGGTGLGLAISQRLAKAMGGEITVTSTENEGSTFTMRLPLNEVTELGRLFDSIEIEEGACVKLLEFKAPHTEVMEKLCRSIGLELVDQCLKCNKASAIPVVFADELGPEQVARILTTDPAGFHIDQAIVVCRPKNAARMRTALGCRTINLPVIPSTFTSLFQVAGKQTNSVPSAPRSQKNEETISILLVEDNSVNQLVFTQLLKNENYTIDLAIDGAEAVKAVSNQHYDIVFMDYMMPVMNGLEAIQAIRRNPNLQAQPYIIALTANAELQAAEDLIGAGAQVYLAKPVRKRDLLDAIEVYLKLRPRK